ncbi:MAG: site-2 protease family protein [Kiritimatiellae bacterium]|nr:site-2 protease family protein [Kiritimatiellia bacterium]MDW8458332.1 site-2 protease family protein [Verrucomicrobiota bacterium]
MRDGEVMFGGLTIARPYGIPIKLHWTLLIFLPFIAFNMAETLGVRSAGWGWLAALGLLASVALHELGHSLVARGRGYPVRDIVLTPIGGVAFLTRSPRRPTDELVIAIAGPVVSIALAVLAWAASPWFLAAGASHLANTIHFLGSINLALAVFNMLPSFPMDGGRVYRAWLANRVGRLEATRRAVRLGRIFAVLFAIVGLFSTNLLLVVIAFVVWQAASAEYRMVQMQERPPYPPFAGFIDPLSVFQTPANRRGPEIVDVEVGPPPYKR